ncbi:MAG: patatin-like phospholipase family protein [Pseudomonadota bacterium]
MSVKPINLALQGGGAHGAFAWGVADKLLEDGRIGLSAITATSAGAMNAAVIAYGTHLDGRDGARAKLEEYWRAVSRIKQSFGIFDVKVFEKIPYFTHVERMVSQMMMEAATISASPYQFNPLGLNPLKDVLEEVIDFDALRSCQQVELFISATNVKTGKVKVFAKEALRVEHLLASACLPQLFQAVEVDGEHYWDGGYMGNPSLWPLFYKTDVADLLVVHINPIERENVPRTPSEISNRINEITFNSALLKEMRAIAFVQKLVDEGWLNESHQGSLSNIRFHSIRADEVMRDLSLSSKFDTDWEFLCSLRDRGREAAAIWLDTHLDTVGKRSSVNLNDEFLDL